MALDFGTTSDNRYVDFGTLGGWAMNSGEISFVVWEYPTAWNYDEWLFMKSNSSWETLGVSHESNDSKIHLLATGSSSWLVRRSDTGFMTLNAWNYVAGVLDLSHFTDYSYSHIYHGDLSNKASEVTYSTNGNGGGTPVDYSSESLLLGRGNPANTYCTGRVAFAALFTKALSFSEVKAIQYNPLGGSIAAGQIKGIWFPGLHGTSTVPDLSGNGYNGTITGATLADHVPLRPIFGIDAALAYEVTAGGLSIPVAMHHLKQQGIS